MSSVVQVLEASGKYQDIADYLPDIPIISVDKL